jgi:hypothetical protein
MVAQTARTDEPQARRILGDAIQVGQLIPDEMFRTRALTYVAGGRRSGPC